MFQEERKENILRILQEREYASVRLLGSLLYASLPTIRRDLTALEAEGLIQRSHGGAILVQDEIRRPLAFRAGAMLPEKKRIAQAAAALIPADSVIFLDASTTAACMIDYLPKKDITVITNSLTALNLLEKHKIRAKCTGGDLLHASRAFSGRMAEHFIETFHTDYCFFSTSSLNAAGQITDYSEPETYLRQAMLRCSKTAVYLFDQTKFGKTATCHVANLAQIAVAVSDLNPPPALRTACRWIQA